MPCIKRWKDSKSNLTAVCLNYPETPEEFKRFSELQYKSNIEALEAQYGVNWGTAVMKKIKERKES